jgi:hypothetical protein
MGTRPISPTDIASDYGNLPSGRQGREGRDFLSPLEQPFYRNIKVHEGRPQAYARAGKNNRDAFSRPSRPIRPSKAVAGPRSSHAIRFAAEIRAASGAMLSFFRILFQGPPVGVLFANTKPPGGHVKPISDARAGFVGHCMHVVCMEFTPGDELWEGTP